MTNIVTELEPRPASIEDTVLVISPNIQLVEKVRDFCVSNSMNLLIGKPNSPDVIAVPYRIGIVDKEWLGEKAWTDWIDFLREVKGEEHDYLLIITLNRSFPQGAFLELERQFEELHKQVDYTFAHEGTDIVKMIQAWLDTGSVECSNDLSNTSRARTICSAKKSQET